MNKKVTSFPFSIILKTIFSLFLINFFFFTSFGQDCESPESLAGPDLEICSGTTATLGYSGSCDYCYKWLPESAFPYKDATLLPNPTTIELEDDITITLYLTNDEGNIVAIVPVNISISIDIDLGDSRTICPGESETLTANVTNGSGNYTYDWSTGETTQTIVVSPEHFESYSVDIEDVNTGCTRTEEVFVFVSRQPDFSIIASAPSICDTEDPAFGSPNPPDENRSAVFSGCDDQKSRLYAGTGLNGYSYLWSTGETTDRIEVDIPGVYSVTVTEDGVCSSTAFYEVTNCLSSLEIDAEDGPNGIPYLNAGDGYVEYRWQDGSTDQLIEVVDEGHYSVTVTNDAGCLATDDVFINDFEFEIKDVYLVYLAFSGGTTGIYNLFVCNDPPSGYNVESINDVILNHRDIKVLVNTQGITVNPPIWGCDVIHSSQAPVLNDLGIDSEKSKLIPMLIKQNDNGEFAVERYYIHYNEDENKNENKFHKYQLNIGTNSYICDLGSLNPHISNFGINFNTLPNSTSAQLSIAEVDGSFSLVNTMTIQFMEEVTNHPFILYHDNAPVPNLIQEEEKTRITFQLKQEKTNGDIVNVEVGKNNVTSIDWSIDGVYVPDLDNLNPINYDVLKFGGNPGTVSALINNNATLLVTIEPTEEDINEGFTFDALPDGTIVMNPNNCETSLPYQQIAEQALSMILADNPDFYNEIYLNNEVVFRFRTASTDSDLTPVVGELGYGYTTITNERDARFYFDDNRIQELEGTSDQKECPIDAPLLILITGDEYSQIYTAIMNIDNGTVPPIVNRINQEYPLIGADLISYCMNTTQDKVGDYLDDVKDWYDDKLLRYAGTDNELLNLIEIDRIFEVTLGVDALSEVGNYIQKGLSCGVSTDWVPMDWCTLDAVYNHPEWVHNARLAKYKQTIAHELAHITFYKENPLDYVKWSYLENYIIDDKLEVPCFPANSDIYCSNHKGHAFMNPNGAFTCEISLGPSPTNFNYNNPIGECAE